MHEYPPHLPPKSCSVPLRKTYHNIIIFLVYTFVALLAGIVGALIVFTWIEPSLYSQNSLYFINRDTRRAYITERYPNSDVVQRLRNVTLRVFDSTQAVGDFFPDSAFLGRVVMLSSSGWGVMYYPDFIPASDATWEIVDQNGITQEIEKTSFDANRGLVYIKFVGNNFYVSSFPAWYTIVPGADLWVAHNKVWHKFMLQDTVVVAQSPYRAVDEYSRMIIDPDKKSGGVVMTADGHVAGFVDTNGLLQTLWHTQYQLPFLLETNELKKDDFGLNGYFVDNVLLTAQSISSGFYITQSTRKDIVKGDIIIRISGETVGPHNFWQQLLSAGDTSNLTIWRGGEEFDILVTR